tara:strand:+ start:599 stop:931 length:333 start_codon:yes stop_codon:yes gene_type:complete
LRGFLHLTVNTRDDLKDDYRDEGSQQSGERVLGPTVLRNFHKLGDEPSDEIHPGHRSSERETTNNGVESLGLKFLGNKIDSLAGSANHGHFIYYTGKIIQVIDPGVLQSF